MKKPSDFKKGEVYRMAVASRSHVKKPYYVIINDTGRGFIETYIPGQHSLKIQHGVNWDYHIRRMTFVGSDHLSRALALNQSL
jgi:hypothetical protein